MSPAPSPQLRTGHGTDTTVVIAKRQWAAGLFESSGPSMSRFGPIRRLLRQSLQLGR
jgi:hypothetical protein